MNYQSVHITYFMAAKQFKLIGKKFWSIKCATYNLVMKIL